jgi:hypothetical protein
VIVLAATTVIIATKGQLGRRAAARTAALTASRASSSSVSRRMSSDVLATSIGTVTVGDDDGGPAGPGPHTLCPRRAGQFRSVPLARSMTSVLSLGGRRSVRHSCVDVSC